MLGLLVSSIWSPVAAQSYKQFNLVSDIPHFAVRTDPNLVNPWGIALSPTGLIWIADNGTGVSTVYYSNGKPFPKPSAPLIVTIPPPAGLNATATPTGVVFNSTSDFVISNGDISSPSFLIFVTEDGTISGWNSRVNPTNAILVVDNSAFGAVYKGVALGSNGTGNFLFATNFRAGTIDIFDGHFNFVRSFMDPTIPFGFAPFGIQNIGGSLYVTYAKQLLPNKKDDEPGPGNGFVDIFDTNGILVRRLASQGALNSPWGLALAPAHFGQFSHDLLVGNFGDGRINAFDPSTGTFLGQLQDIQGNPIIIDDLWALTFGKGGDGEKSNILFFTAGIEEESHGLFGRLQAVSKED